MALAPSADQPAEAPPAGSQGETSPTESPAPSTSPRAAVAVDPAAPTDPALFDSPPEAAIDPEAVFRDGAIPWFPTSDTPLADLTPAQRRTYLATLANALRSGLRTGRGPTADELQRAGEALRKSELLADRDHRLPYAAGLIALSAEDWPAAGDRFTRARELASKPHLGATIGLIYSHLARRRLREAADECQTLAQQLADSSPETTPAALAEASSRWLGKAVACCTAEPTTPAVELNRDAIRERLPESLRALFDQGYEAVAPRYAQMLSWTTLPASDLAEQYEAVGSALEREVTRLTMTEQAAIARRKELRDSLAVELKTQTKPLVQMLNKYKAEQAAGRQAERRMQELAERNARPFRPKPQRIRNAEEARRAQRDDLERQQKEAREQQKRERELGRLRAEQETRQKALSELETSLAHGREARKQLEAKHAGQLRERTAEVDAAQRARAEAAGRLQDLKTAFSHRDQLIARLHSPETWLSLNLAGQRDALIESLTQP